MRKISIFIALRELLPVVLDHDLHSELFLCVNIPCFVKYCHVFSFFLIYAILLLSYTIRDEGLEL